MAAGAVQNPEPVDGAHSLSGGQSAYSQASMPLWNVCLVQRHLHRNMQTIMFDQIPGPLSPTTLPRKLAYSVGFSHASPCGSLKRMGPSLVP